MKKEEKGGMRSARMPSEQFERNEGELNATSNLKYATEFGNPKDLEKSTKDLANFVRKHQMKY